VKGVFVVPVDRRRRRREGQWCSHCTLCRHRVPPERSHATVWQRLGWGREGRDGVRVADHLEKEKRDSERERERREEPSEVKSCTAERMVSFFANPDTCMGCSWWRRRKATNSSKEMYISWSRSAVENISSTKLSIWRRENENQW
jgi:hypothetical protein